MPRNRVRLQVRLILGFYAVTRFGILHLAFCLLGVGFIFRSQAMLPYAVEHLQNLPPTHRQLQWF